MLQYSGVDGLVKHNGSLPSTAFVENGYETPRLTDPGRQATMWDMDNIGTCHHHSSISDEKGVKLHS
jgi:hypothetical protein